MQTQSFRSFIGRTLEPSGHPSRRCTSGRQVQSSPVHVPTNSTASAGSSQGQAWRGGCDFHPSLVAEERLVPAGHEFIDRPSCASTSSAKSDKESLWTLWARSQHPPVSRLAVLGDNPSSRSFLMQLPAPSAVVRYNLHEIWWYNLPLIWWTRCQSPLPNSSVGSRLFVAPGWHTVVS